jgi:hypothetical protein
MGYPLHGKSLAAEREAILRALSDPERSEGELKGIASYSEQSRTGNPLQPSLPFGELRPAGHPLIVSFLPILQFPRRPSVLRAVP